MLKVNSIQTNFSSGELSPWLLGRSDIERYQNGAEIVENFLVKPQGGISRRRGTRFIGLSTEQDETKTVRLLDFAFSRTDSVTIEIKAGSFNIFGATPQFGQVVNTIYGTTTAVPYLNADINDLQFTQSADVIYITHNDHPPATLSRYSGIDWRYEQPEIEYGPYLDQDPGDQDISLTINRVTDRVQLTSITTDDFSSENIAVDDFVQYKFSGQSVLGLVTARLSDESVDVEPLEDRSLVLSKEVYSPGLYTSWDSTNSIPVYDSTITGEGVSVAFSAVGVVTQEHVGNYLRFSDRSGTYYWMLVTGVEDILRQGAYGIIATGDILTVYQPTGIITRGKRRTNARLQSSVPFFDLDTDPNRLFRLVLDGNIVHARGRTNASYSVVGHIPAAAEENRYRVDLSYEDASLCLVGDSITGTNISGGTTITAVSANDIQSYITISIEASAPYTGGTFTISRVDTTYTVNGNTGEGFARVYLSYEDADNVIAGDTITGTHIPNATSYTVNGNIEEGLARVDLSYEDADALVIGDTITGTGIPASTTILSKSAYDDATSYTVGGNTGEGEALVYLSYEDADALVIGDTITGTHIPASTTILSKDANDEQSFATISAAATGSAIGTTFTISRYTQSFATLSAAATASALSGTFTISRTITTILSKSANDIQSFATLSAIATASAIGTTFTIGRSSTTFVANGNIPGNADAVLTRVDTSFEDANTILPGDTITGTNIPANTTVVACFPNEIQSYITISAAASAAANGVTFVINASNTTDLGVTLNRSVPRSIEGLTTVQNGTTNDWNRGAWYAGNYPCTVSFHEGRLGFAGSIYQPQTVWLSKTDDIHNFATTDEKLRVLDDSAITFTIASDTVNQVIWMQSRQVLLLGSVGSEWRVSSTSPGAPLTPTTVSVSVQSSYGSEAVKPISIGKSCIYLQRGGNKLREMSYDYQTDSQVSLDLTVFSEHILKDHGGVTQLAYQAVPEPTIYALLADGQVAVFAYEPDQKVYAWSRLEIGGPQAVVESIACVPARYLYTYYEAEYWNDTFEDPNAWIYMVVRRYINGDWVRSIEYLEPEFRPDSTTDRERMIFMDSYQLWYDQSGVNAPKTVITGLTRFAGCTVSVVYDDLVVEDLVVTSEGVLTLPSSVSSYLWVGFAYTSTLKTFPIESPAQFGTGQGKQKRISKISLRLRDSIDFNHGSSLDDMREESFRVSADPVDESPPMFTGDKLVEYENGYDTRGSFYITQTKSYPLSILALMPEFAQMN